MIPQYEPLFDREAIAKKVNEYILSDGYMTEYKNTQKFEGEIAKFIGAKHCILVNNGTISLSLALLAHGIKPGDKIIVPALSMIATANAVTLIGAEPVFVDIDKATLCLDLLETLNYTEAKAIIYVSLNGRSVDLEILRKYCKAMRITFIEDNAQSFGSKYQDGTMMGNTDNISSFSFSMPKIICSGGQGGCLTTNNDGLATKLRQLKDFGRERGGADIHPAFGINSKFTEIQAIIGLNQLSNIEWRIKRKKEIYQQYYDALKNIKQINFIQTDLEITTPWFIDVNILSRVNLQKYLEQNGIQTRAMYPPMNEQQCYVDHPQHFEKFENAIYYGENVIWLPSSLSLSDDDISFIGNKIKEYYR